MNKNFKKIFWGFGTYRSRGITRVPSGEQPHRRSTSEGRRDGPCRTETLAMCCVRFGLFHVISVKVIYMVIGNSLKNLFQSFAWQYANNSSISQGLLAFFYWQIWLQLGTWNYKQHLSGQTCKIVIIPYQLLNAEQKNVCLLWESVENSDAAWPRTNF